MIQSISGHISHTSIRGHFVPGVGVHIGSPPKMVGLGLNVSAGSLPAASRPEK